MPPTLSGVAAEPGHLDVPFFRYDRNFNYGGVSVEFIKGLDQEAHRVRVPLQPLDTLLQLTKLDFLKLDVEHLELEALQESHVTQDSTVPRKS